MDICIGNTADGYTIEIITFFMNIHGHFRHPGSENMMDGFDFWCLELDMIPVQVQILLIAALVEKAPVGICLRDDQEINLLHQSPKLARSQVSDKPQNSFFSRLFISVLGCDKKKSRFLPV